MTEDADKSDETTPPAAPPPISRLDTNCKVRREMVRVYREMREGTLKANVGTKLVYVLQAIGGILENELIERRLDAIEAALAKGLQNRTPIEHGPQRLTRLSRPLDG